MLLNDAKWDMRIYVMLESLNPFRAHLFKVHYAFRLEEI